MTNIVEKGLANFQKILKEIQNKEALQNSQRQRIIEEKKRIVLPVVDLLRQLKSMNISVGKNREKQRAAAFMTDNVAPFEFYQKDSEGRDFEPGISIVLENPCQIIISVPNEMARERLGVIVLHVESNTDHINQISLLQRRFDNVDDVVLALSTFIAHNVQNVANI